MDERPKIRRAMILACISSGWDYHARDAKTDEFIGYVSMHEHPIKGNLITITHDGKARPLMKTINVMVSDVDESAWD